MKTKIGTPYFGVVIALLAGAALVGCDKAPPPAPPQAAKPSAPAAAPKAPAPPTAAAPAPLTEGAKLEKAGWTLLGQQQADRVRDTDRFVVGNKGAFREIEITVEGAPLDMESLVVTFGNGEQFKPTLGHNFNANSHSRAINLPGEKRGIQHIDLAYRSDSTTKQGKATVKIYAR